MAKAAAAASTADEPRREEPRGEPAEPLEKRLTGYAKVGVPLATLGVAGVVGATVGTPSAVLVLAGGALVGVIATFWASVRTLLGETPLAGADAYALGAPRAEEEQKRAVLRALKDLEFEHNVGKISDDDYKELVTKYRAEAKRLLRLLDTEAAPARQEVEALVARRLRKEGLLEGAGEAADAGEDDTGDESPRAKKKKGKRARAAEREAEREREEARQRELEAEAERERARAAAAAAADEDEDEDEDEETDDDADDEAGEAASDTKADDEASDGKSDDDDDDADDDEEPEKAAAPAKPSAPPAPLRMKARESATGTVCSKCGVSNDEDAVFCKKCGTRRGEAAAAEEEA